MSPLPASNSCYDRSKNKKKLEQAILALNNEIIKMRTETEWKSEARSAGQGSEQSYRSEYSSEAETLWIEFTAIFNERRKREKRSPMKMYNVLSEEIDLSPSTLAKFYQHQKSPQRVILIDETMCHDILPEYSSTAFRT
ncbi:hypothetical protein Glove_642g36 [Diversispora epigaea]|uniref:Uncharacterized protein n=1 Tax=Diversispora epigaea TaxID=1348612 RepID=A0A397GAG1_9GLOM|nr:hypothetical protein Glove_642g36 [Diversispora epigaea]